MNSLSLSHPVTLALRALQAGLVTAARICGVMAEAVQRHGQARARSAPWQAEQLPPALLHDIGAPEWLRIAAERELARERARLAFERLLRS